MKPGVMDPVIGGRDDAEVFARAARSGFAGVEVVLARSELRAAGDRRLAALRAASRATSLPIPSLVLGEHNEGGLGDPDPGVARAAADDVEAAISWAAALGAEVILVPFFLRGELAGAEPLARVARAFRELCPLAAARGVTLCYEGTLPADVVRQLAADVGSPAFGCYFDLANPVVRGLDTATEARTLGDLVRRVHLKDTRVRGGDCHPGLGRVDFAESARALDEIGYDGWLVLETPPAPEPLVRRDLSFARSVFALTGAPRWPTLGASSSAFGSGEGERLVATFGALGLEAVQIGGGLLEACLADPGAAGSLHAVLDGAGIAAAALAGGRDPGAVERCLEIAPLLGAAVVAVEPGPRHRADDWIDVARSWSPNAWEDLGEAIGPLLAVAERAGTVLALEARADGVLKTPGQLLGLLERFPSEHLQVVGDPYRLVSRRLVAAQERVVRDVLDRFEHRFVLARLEGAQPPYLEFLRTRRPDLPLILDDLPLDRLPAAAERIRAIAAG